MKLIVLLIILFVIAGLVEHFRHQRSLAKIPVRIHVNGTRGKSSVTRLIAAGLRAGGVRCPDSRIRTVIVFSVAGFGLHHW